MKPISTFGQTQLRNAQLRSLEAQLATANNELGTGKKEDVAKAIGNQLINLQSIRNQLSENDAYLRSIDLFKQRADLMDSSLAEAETAVVDLLEVGSINGADALDSASTVPLVAESLIDRIITSLNVQIGGRYLFGGAAVDRNPLQAFLNPGAGGVSPRDIAEQITRGTTGVAGLPVTDLSTPADVLQADELLTRFDDVFQGGNAGSADPLVQTLSFEETLFNGEINGTLIEIRLPNNTIETQLNADFVQGLRDVLQGAYVLSQVNLEDITDDAAYRRLMTGEADAASGLPARDGALDLIAKGLSAIQRVRSDLGLRYQIVEAAEDATRAQNALFNNEIVALEGVDRAEVTTRLLDVENQLEAAYSATGRVLNLSIWNFVR